MKKFIGFTSSLLLFLFSANQAHAFAIFPGETLSGYREYIGAFYTISIPIGLLVATVLIMIGGVIWITSAGDQGRIAKAKEFIIQPIIGVVILAGAYTLLAFINPNLVDLKLQITTLQNVQGGSCQTIDPNTYKSKTPAQQKATCLQGCITTKDANDCQKEAEKLGRRTNIFLSESCNQVCSQKEQVVACGDITPFSTATVSDCNRTCFDRGGQGCFGKSLVRTPPTANLGICTCHKGAALQITSQTDQVREDRLREVRQERTRDPYQVASAICSNQSQSIGEEEDASFPELRWIDDCNDWCSNADGADYTGPSPDGSGEITRECRVDEGSSRCEEEEDNLALPDRCIRAYCACGMYNPALHFVTGS